MEVSSAIALINEGLVYKPDWVLVATDHTSRFEGSICLEITSPTYASEKEQALLGYPNEIRPMARFCVCVATLDIYELVREVIQCINRYDLHETREFLRLKPSYWAPFHPHRHDGMERWGTPESDRHFGLT